MKRITILTTILALMVIGLAVPAQAATGVEMSPAAGAPGTTVALHATGFTPGSNYEIHGGSLTGPILASGVTSGIGDLSTSVAIPSGTAAGPYRIEICETTFVACADSWSDFWVGTSATFTVTVIALPPAGVIVPLVPLLPPAAPAAPLAPTVEPAITLTPDSGYAGAATTASIVGFTPNSTFEIHAGGYGARFLGAGSTDARGEGEVTIRVPRDAAVGSMTIAACETSFVACADTWSDFWVGAAATFTVEELGVLPPVAPVVPVTTTTIAAATDTVADTTTTTVADTSTTTAATIDETLIVTSAFDTDASTNTSGAGSGLWWLLLLALIAAAILGALTARRYADNR